MPNTNSQTIHQMGQAINAVVRQATGRDVVQNIDMDFVTVAQNKTVQVFDESIPYMFRRTGGGINIGNARLSRNKVIGGTLAWNQLCTEIESGTVQGLTITKNADGTISFSGTPLTTYVTLGSIQTIKDHIYIYKRKSVQSIWSLFYSNWFQISNSYDDYRIVKGTENNTNDSFGIAFKDTQTEVSGTASLQFFDLTQMFGSTIADYIYSLEQTTAGAGVAWFRKYFHDAYYDYNSGELLSVSGLVSHDMTGFNQWDEEWELGGITWANGVPTSSSNRIRSKNYIHVLPGTTYYYHCGNNGGGGVAFYDSEKAFLSSIASTINNTFTTPEMCYYIKFVNGSNINPIITYNHDICINFSDPNLNGKYEPYQIYSYPLDSDLVLRGIPKLDSNNKLYYDGDTYEPDGTVTLKYGIVDLGMLSWTFVSDPAWNCFYTNELTTKKNGVANFICGKYPYSPVYNTDTDKIISGNENNENIYIRDSAYSDAASFKASLSGMYLVFELATPTTETADPFSDPQVVSPYGTEEYITTGIVPVGNETQYLELTDTNM